MFYLQFCILCMFDIMYMYDNKAILNLNLNLNSQYRTSMYLVDVDICS